MTDPATGFDLAEFVRRSCLACGVPERLEDPGVAAVVAEILDPDHLMRPRGDRSRGRRTPSTRVSAMGP